MSRGRRTRLTDSPEFERVYRQGKVYRGRLFSVHVFPNGLGHPRLGLSVSRKVGGAVTRNAVRRRLREVFHGSVGDEQGGVDFVISARPAASEASFHDLKEEFERALRRLEVGGG